MRHNLSNDINLAVRLLEKKEIIIHSTDTLPGLACDATSDRAINKIIRLKNRTGPFSIIVNSIEDIKNYSIFNDRQIMLIRKILPGPFTVLLRNNEKNELSKLATNESILIGFRIPNHNFTNQLSKRFNKPIITTSINLTGQAPVIDLKKIPNDFKHLHIYNDGNKKLSKGSTILDFSNKKITILRNGDGIYNK